MDNARTLTFAITPAHSAYLLDPARLDPQAEKWCIRVPAEEFPECDIIHHREFGPSVMAGSNREPLIMIGEKNAYLDCLRWSALIGKAKMWKYPLNRLLEGRTITIAARSYLVNNIHFKNKTALHLIAVKLHADEVEEGQNTFTKDAGLEEHIRETMAFMNSETTDD